MQTEQDQIRAYRAQVLNADTLEALQSIAVQMIGHAEGFDGDDARADLLDYLSEWELDAMRREFNDDEAAADAPVFAFDGAYFTLPDGLDANIDDPACCDWLRSAPIGAEFNGCKRIA